MSHVSFLATGTDLAPWCYDGAHRIAMPATGKMGVRGYEKWAGKAMR